VIEKSPSKTTFAHGPGQPAGGVKENDFGEKSANATFVKSDTTQGCAPGRATGGSAVTVFADPIVGPGQLC
jgi:hypothetical protein